jgi:hypothetical protein
MRGLTPVSAALRWYRGDRPPSVQGRLPRHMRHVQPRPRGLASPSMRGTALAFLMSTGLYLPCLAPGRPSDMRPGRGASAGVGTAARPRLNLALLDERGRA